VTAVVLSLIHRDLRLGWRQGADAALTVGFFALCALLFPLALGPDPEALKRAAAGAVWIAATLASLLPTDRLFAADAEDGSLDRFLLSPHPLEVLVLAKMTAHWLTTGLPLAVASVPIAVMLNLDPEGLVLLVPALLIGSAILCMIATVGAALTLRARRGGVLIPLLVLPLDIPVLIFGTGAVQAAMNGLATLPHVEMLAALLCVALPLAPLAAAAALRLAAE
jgi:heme exporter protein B